MLDPRMAGLYRAVVKAAQEINLAAHELAEVFAKLYELDRNYLEDLIHLFRNYEICKPGEAPPKAEDSFLRPGAECNLWPKPYIPIEREPP